VIVVAVLGRPITLLLALADVPITRHTSILESLDAKLLATHFVVTMLGITSSSSHVPMPILVGIFALVFLQPSLQCLVFELLVLLVTLGGFL